MVYYLIVSVNYFEWRNKMKTTLREIKSFDPCVLGWKKLLTGLGTTDLDTGASVLQILEINGVKDAFWALRTQEYEDYCLINADIVESVLYIFEEKYHDDSRPREAIDAIRKYKNGEITKKELKVAASAAYAAYYAASAVYSAASRAAYSAAYYAAYYAVYSAASRAASRAAYSAAYYAAYSDAAYDAQWAKNEEILRKHLMGETI
jgi:hypothetical protein